MVSTATNQGNPPASGHTDEEWQRIAGTGQILVRSRIEISRFLQETAAAQTPLSVSVVKDQVLLQSRLRHIDPNLEFILVDFSNDRAINTALLAARAATFIGSRNGARFQFLALRPLDTTFAGAHMVRLDFPGVLMIQQRPARQHIRVVPDVPLRCTADTEGVISFECDIIDVSRGGFGTMVYDDSILLEPGTLLKGCKILHPRGSSVTVNIEVRHCTKVTLGNGKTARRAGCSFIGSQAEIDELLKVFILNLEGPG